MIIFLTYMAIVLFVVVYVQQLSAVLHRMLNKLAKRR